jgi:hypothetical protein
MSAIAERQALLRDTDELVLRSSLDGTSFSRLFPEVVEAERVERFGVCVVVGVGVDSDGWDFNGHAGGDPLAVGEGEWCEDFTLEGC